MAPKANTWVSSPFACRYSKKVTWKVKKHRDTRHITTNVHVAVDKTKNGEHPDKWKGFKKRK